MGFQTCRKRELVDVRQQLPKLSGLPGGHPALLIQIDCPVRQDYFARIRRDRWN
jgi:hypothetical protein